MLSIIIPHYRTEKHIRLCLRSLRKYSRGDVQVIVVDNNSADSSVEYLRNVSWIELIENSTELLGSLAHRQALDLGVEKATGEWLCLFHSDTIVLKPGWDMILMQKIKTSHAVGFSTIVRDINLFEQGQERWKRKLTELRRNVKQRFLKKGTIKKIMSFCFIVQKRIIQDSEFSFSTANGDATTILYHEKIKGKHPFLLLGREELKPLLWHTSNVTSILTGQITEQSLANKCYSKNRLLLELREIQENLRDKSVVK